MEQLESIIREYFKQKGLQFKDSNTGQFVLEKCPFCGDNAFHHFYMGKDNGLYNCKKCSASGNFNQFRSAFGDGEIQLPESGFVPQKEKSYRDLNYKIALDNASYLWGLQKDFQDYLLNTRKLDKGILERFKIGADTKGIAIPIYEDGNLVNIRYRRNPALDSDPNSGAKYSSEIGCKTALFNGDILKTGIKECFITEGEFDAMQLIQRGVENTVSVTLGAGYFSKEWVEKFVGVTNINIIYDNDEAGRDGAKKAAEALGPERCRLVSLPLIQGRAKTDISNYFVDDNHTKKEFFEILKLARSATNVDDDSVKHISEFTDELRRRLIEGEYLGIGTGYGKLDAIVGGFRAGRLIVLSGLTNSGKTSLALNIALNMARSKQSIFYLSLEMPPIDIAKKLLMLEAKLGNTELKTVEDPSDTLRKIDAGLFAFRKGEDGLPIYLYKGSGTIKYEVLAESAKIAKEKYSAECIFVDHLHYFAQSHSNVTQETAQIVRKIKQLAIQLDIPIVLLAHLNRGGRTTQRKGLYIPSLADLKDTSTIEQDADQVIFVCRDSEAGGEDGKKVVVKVAKNRDGYAGESVSMIFDPELTTFLEEPGVNYEKEVKDNEHAKSLEIDISDISI